MCKSIGAVALLSWILISVVGCDPVGPDDPDNGIGPSVFVAAIEGDVVASLSGAAAAGEDTYPETGVDAFVISMVSDDGAHGITLFRLGPRPEAGQYGIGPMHEIDDETPPDEFYADLIISDINFTAHLTSESGMLEITEVTETHIAGTFEIDSSGELTDAEGETETVEVIVTGQFQSVPIVAPEND